MMQAPEGQSLYTYPETPSPIVSLDPSRSRPIGIGGISACGQTLSMQAALDMFSAPVDLYLALSLPVPGSPLYLLHPDYSLHPLSEGLVPWKTQTTGPIEETIFTPIDTSGLPVGTYTLYLLASLAGSLDHYYLWTSHFKVRPPAASSGPVTKSVGAKGGVIQAPNLKARLEIPQGALPSPTSITMQPVPISSDSSFVQGTGWRLLPDSLELMAPVRLIVCYDPAALPSSADGRLLLYKAGKDEWTGVPGSEEIPGGNAVMASLSSFSDYGLRLVPVPGATWIEEARPSSDTIYSFAKIEAGDSVEFPGGHYANTAAPAAGFSAFGKPDACGFVTGGSPLGEYQEFSADVSVQDKGLISKMHSYTIFEGVGDLFQIGFDGSTQTKALKEQEPPFERKVSSNARLYHGLGPQRARTFLRISNPSASIFDIRISWSVSGEVRPDNDDTYFIYDFYYHLTKCGGDVLSSEWFCPVYSETEGAAYAETYGPLCVHDGTRRIRINRLEEVELLLSVFGCTWSSADEETPKAHSSLQGWLKVELLPVIRR